MALVCTHPFISLEIDQFGDVYTCCPGYINYNKIGNIFEKDNCTLESIWHSEVANNLREKILNDDYSMCNLEICRQKSLEENINSKYHLNPDLPTYITLSYDKECNLQCITCRDEKIKNTKEKEEILNNKIDSLLFPLLKNAQIIALSGAGEAFFSPHSRLLIKKLTSNKKNSSLKFNINTNGILFNEANCNELGLNNRINEVFVSLPAIDKKIYNKIMIGSNLDVVLNNIKWMANESKEKRINKITINTVISDLNYKEIPKLVDFARKLDIFITISQYQYWGTSFGKNYSDIAIWEKGHKNHKKFINILKDKKLNYEKIFLSPLFAVLREAN